MNETKYNLSVKQSLAWHYLNDPDVNEVFFGGGAGLGKSDLICIFEITGAKTYPETIGLIGRNRFADLRDSTLLTFHKIAKILGYKQGVDYRYNQQEHIVYWDNGSMTFFRDLFFMPSDPDFQSLGSTAFTRVSIDEAPEVTKKAKEIINSRIRHNLAKYGLTPKLLMTGNPGDHWIKNEYVFDEKDKPVVLKSHQRVVLGTVLDNPDPEFVALFKSQLERMSDNYDKARLLHGDWLAKRRTGMEFFDKFSGRNVRKNTFNPELPLHITFDFNSIPYMTLLTAQIIRKELWWEVNFMKNYCLSHPFNRTKSICQKFKYDIEQPSGSFFGFNSAVFYYGDYSGKNRNPLSEQDLEHHYKVIESELIKYMPVDRVTKNPPHMKAKNFINDCFDEKLPIRIFIDSDMIETIRDLSSLKQGPDGLMLKEYANDNITSSRYEKWGHCSQAMYYLVISAFRNLFDEYRER